MKLVKISFIVAVAFMAIIGIGTTSYAFHDGGVASCESCHTMHNSFGGAAMSGKQGTTFGAADSAAAAGSGSAVGSSVYLLRGADQSSTCLNCHEGATLSSYHVSTDAATISASPSLAPVNRGPGGDFGWLRNATTTSTTSPSERHGHNIIAADYGYTVDLKNTQAPGGSFISANLNCISCHNPHNNLRRTDENGTQATSGAPIVASGSYDSSPAASGTAAVGVYRFLRGASTPAKSYPGFSFANTAPDAVAPKTYNRTEATSDTHVAYGQGMSAWCGNCHTAFNDQTYNSGQPSHPHPVNVTLGGTTPAILANYNAYVKTGDMSGNAGVTSGGYSSLVPVEMGSAAYATLKTAATNTAHGGSNPGADASSKVMCLSCHRAHAGGFESMTRFNVAGTITDTAGLYTLAGGLTTTAQMTAAYYDRPSTVFATYQRTLCNKCHAKD